MEQTAIGPDLFHRFLTEIAIPLRPLATTNRVLKSFEKGDVDARSIAEVLQGNPYIDHFLTIVLRSKGFKGDAPSIHAIVSLLGMEPSRNLVCAMQLFRRITRQHLEVTAEGKLKLEVDRLLRYGIKAETFATEQNIEHEDVAFSAGLLFDYLAFLAEQRFHAKGPFFQLLDQVFDHGLRTGRIAYELSSQLTQFRYSRYIFAAGLLHDIGKPVMDLLFPAECATPYSQFQADMLRGAQDRFTTHFKEKERFGITHEHFSSMLAFHFDLFKPIERGLLFHHDPYLVVATDPWLYDFASILATASNMATSLSVPKDSKDPIFDRWLPAELKDFPLKRDTLIRVATRLSQSR